MPSLPETTPFISRPQLATRTSAAVGCLAAACVAVAPLASLGRGPDPASTGPVAAALRPHFVRQLTDASCSVAALTTVVNAARAPRGMAPLSQQEVLDAQTRADGGRWAAATAHRSGDGVSLAELGRLAHEVGEAAGLGLREVEVLPITADTPELRARVWALLEAQGRAPHELFVVVNFLQSRFTPEGDPIGHHSLVADLDPAARRVAIFDVDPEVTGEYWVGWDDFIGGMLPQDAAATTRGLVVISRQPSPEAGESRPAAARLGAAWGAESAAAAPPQG